MDTTIVVTGEAEILRLLNVTIPQAAEEAVDPVAEAVWTLAKTYPSGGSGKRTGRLGRGWQLVVNGSTIQATNNVSYAPYVQSAAYQSASAAFHGWLTDEDIAKRVESGEAERLAEDAIEQALP